MRLFIFRVNLYVKKSSVQWRLHVEFHKKNILFKLDKFELFCLYFMVNWHWLVFGAISSLDRRLYDKLIIYTLFVTISLFGLSIFCCFIKLELKALSVRVRIKNQCFKFFLLSFWGYGISPYFLARFST